MGDTFSVTNSGSSAPMICGTNSGEHMYVDAAQECNGLAFQFGSTANGVGAVSQRSWSIKVSQLDCNSPGRAPDECTQYYTGSDSGTVSTYNYNNGNGYHLANQKICIRQERGNCRICWSTSALTDFQISGKQAMKQGKIDTCCGYGMDGKKSNYDCVRIPSATKFAIATKASDQSIKKGSGFCGNRGLVSTTGATLATVCSKRVPFQIRFLSDAYELVDESKANADPAMDVTNRGFKLHYVMSASNC